MLLRLERPLNELLDETAVRAALRRAARLAPSNLPQAVRLKTLHAYRTTFAGCRIVETPGRMVCWRGPGDGETLEGGLARATIDVFEEDPDHLWRRTTHELVERHHPRLLVEGALSAAGLELVEIHGDEDAEHITYVARATHVRRGSSRHSRGAGGMPAPATRPAQVPTRA